MDTKIYVSDLMYLSSSNDPNLLDIAVKIEKLIDENYVLNQRIEELENENGMLKQNYGRN